LSQFYLHFFKEKSRELDKEKVIEFFDNEPGFEVEMDERSVRIYYTHPTLGYPCAFYLTPKSQVPNIQRISPKYLEVNFHLELPILSPTYFVKSVIQIVKKICDKFNLYVLSEMFSDVLEFNQERILKVFQMVKKAFLEKYPQNEEKYFFVKEDKLSGALRYIDEIKVLQDYYDDLETIVPKYHLIKDENNKPYFACEWKEMTLTVIPPYTDLLLFHQADGVLKVIDYQEFLEKNKKLLLDVPGFLQGTKVIPKKQVKKLSKSAKKDKWIPVSHSFAKYHLHELLD